MGNLSEHFSHNDFSCKCPNCKGRGEYKIHLGLVGGLELLLSEIKKPIKILAGFRCEESSEKSLGVKKNFHYKGKAADVSSDTVPLKDLFKAAEKISEFKGLGFCPEENCIHVDTRPGDREEWIKEAGKHNPLTKDKKRQLDLI